MLGLNNSIQLPFSPIGHSECLNFELDPIFSDCFVENFFHRIDFWFLGRIDYLFCCRPHKEEHRAPHIGYYTYDPLICPL